MQTHILTESDAFKQRIICLRQDILIVYIN